MAKTYALVGMSVDIPNAMIDFPITNSPVAERDTITDLKTGDQTTTYVVPSGAVGLDTEYVARQATQKRAGLPIKRPSFTTNTFVAETDSVSGAVVHDPVSCSIAFTYPDGRPIPANLLAQLCAETFFRLMEVPSTTGIAETRIANLQHSITRVLG